MPAPSQRPESVLPPVLAQVKDNCRVTDRLLDTDAYRVSMATLWANIVLSPEESGFEESDLEQCYEILSSDCTEVLGADTELKDVFAFLSSKPGAAAMQQARLPQNHRDMLLFFASMMLDPDGHRRWTSELRAAQGRGTGPDKD
ncbi:MAG: hypothetical protein AAF648_04385 [Pseudomonadota bacterium]